jgi:MFS family permease
MTETVLLYALFNTTCVAAAPWVGWLGDRIGRNRIVLLGYAVYAGLTRLVFASSRWESPSCSPCAAIFAIDESQRPSSPTLSQSGAPRRWAFTTLSSA